jgi:hypothetical protein
MKEFYADVRDKKALVPSSRHRVCGAKSKKCTLPSDNLTAAQKRKLNGPCETYAVNKPCDYETFKAMPHDIAQEWLDYVQDRFGAGPCTISTEVFGGRITRAGFTTYLSRKGFKVRNGGRLSKIGIDALRTWVTGDVTEESVPVVEEPAAAEEVEQEPEQKPVALEALVVSERVSMELVGPWEAIRAELERRFAGQRVALTVNADICCTLGGDAGG